MSDKLDKLLGEIKPVEEKEVVDVGWLEEEAKENGLFKSPKEIKIAKETLNPEQLDMFDGLKKFVEGDEHLVVVIGYAGTGKTYAISKFISIVKGSVAMTAPTNKAVKVLMENKSSELGSVSYTTIHKMLALKLKWVYPKKNDKFKPYQVLAKNWGSESTVNSYDIIIVDEVSMLSDELFHLLQSEKSLRTKVIFLGDPAQIPPVRDKRDNSPEAYSQDSIPLIKEKRKNYDIDAFFLEKIMRQSEGSGILKAAYSIRTKRFGTTDVIEDRTNMADTFFLKRHDEDDLRLFNKKIISEFTSDSFKENPDHCKVIAWRNVAVDSFNNLIRQHIFHTKDLKPLMPGEKLIADKPIMKKGETKYFMGKKRNTYTTVFNTSDEFEVISYTDNNMYYEIEGSKEAKQQIVLEGMDLPTKKKGYNIKYLTTLVRYKPIGEDCWIETMIDILHPDGYDPLKYALSDLIRHKKYDDYEELTNRFAKTKYNYAITCHKAQGSTYGTVFLIEDDIDRNRNLLERNRIKYTAASRPKTALYILSRRN